MSRRFEGKVAIVTGAGGGIGAAICAAFARDGATLVVVDVAEEGTRRTVRQIEQLGGRAHALIADVADAAAVSSLFTEAVSRVGTIHFAVNNAGVSPNPPVPTAEIELADWQRVVGVNLTGTWLCMREELRHMTERNGGAIVNLGSIASLRTLANQSAYVASKHAVAGLTKNAALEYAPAGIRLNAICPGSVPTPMFTNHAALLDTQGREQAYAAAAARHPMGRIGTADEIAEMAMFLCSDAASFVTGQCIAVDGGRSVA